MYACFRSVCVRVIFFVRPCFPCLSLFGGVPDFPGACFGGYVVFRAACFACVCALMLQHEVVVAESREAPINGKFAVTHGETSLKFASTTR